MRGDTERRREFRQSAQQQAFKRSLHDVARDQFVQIVTNPPLGRKFKLAARFIEAGLDQMPNTTCRRRWYRRGCSTAPAMNSMRTIRTVRSKNVGAYRPSHERPYQPFRSARPVVTRSILWASSTSAAAISRSVRMDAPAAITASSSAISFSRSLIASLVRRMAR